MGMGRFVEGFMANAYRRNAYESVLCAEGDNSCSVLKVLNPRQLFAAVSPGGPGAGISGPGDGPIRRLWGSYDRTLFEALQTGVSVATDINHERSCILVEIHIYRLVVLKFVLAASRDPPFNR